MSTAPARQAVDGFLAGFNAGDIEAQIDAMNFPHVRLAEGRFAVIDTPEAFRLRTAALPSALQQEGWGHSTLERAELVHAGPDKVHFALTVTRRREDGSAYNTFDTLWIATLQDGHWGVQFRSSYLETARTRED